MRALRSFQVIALAVVGTLLPTLSAEARPIEDGWMILDSHWVVLAGDRGTRSEVLKENEALKLYDVLPRHQFELEQEAKDERGRTRIAAGTSLLAIQGRDDLWCEVKRKSGNERFVCLADLDGDGRPEHHFQFRQNTELFINRVEVNVRLRPLGGSVGVRPVEWQTEGESFVIELYFKNRAEWGKKNFLSVCINRGDLRTVWGSQMDSRICLGEDIILDDDEYPFSARLYGGSFSIASREEDFVSVVVVPPTRDFSF